VRPSQQVLKVKIDDRPRKTEATLESAVWQATLRLPLRAGFLEKREKWRTPKLFRSMLKNKPALYFVAKMAHPAAIEADGS
jgi:hypothetical protein